MASDTLVSFAGIQPETFTKSSLVNFLADFTYKFISKKTIHGQKTPLLMTKSRLQDF